MQQSVSAGSPPCIFRQEMNMRKALVRSVSLRMHVHRISKELKGIFIMVGVGHSLGRNNHLHVTGVGHEILAKIDSLKCQSSTGMFLLGDSKHVCCQANLGLDLFLAVA